MGKLILVTGAAGFIGSHTCVELLNAGFEVVGVDNLINSRGGVFNQIEKICGKQVSFIKLDLLDQDGLSNLFKKYPFDGVIHFAALKAVGESVNQPLRYYDNNIVGLVNLLKVSQDACCQSFVFSSSATVYGAHNPSPLIENMSTLPENPYGRSKLFGEQIVKDYAEANQTFQYHILRYFNPVGAHPTGLIGELPNSTPNNLMPLIAEVAANRRSLLKVYGNDWPTADGTGVRDYIHVCDVARAHVLSLMYLFEKKSSGIFNIGTGYGHSVLEVLEAYQKASGRIIPYQYLPRRDGDVAISYANSNLARQTLDWSPIYKLDEMCRDSWNFITKHITNN